MSTDRTPEQLRELLGAYALDALGPDERAEVDALLLNDPDARAELHELEHAAAWLGHASLRPPARVWQGIEAEVRTDLEHGVTPESAAGDESQEPDAGSVTPLHPRRIGRWMLAAAAVVVLVAAIGSAVVVVSRDGSPNRVAEQYQAAQRNDAAQHASLRTDDGRVAARAIVLPDGTGYLADVSLPPAGDDRVLQLWSLTSDGAVSAGVLTGTTRIHRFHTAPGTTALAVTNEPRGGSRMPTSTPIMRGAVSA